MNMTGKVWKCSRCGQENQGEFCSSCGKPRETESDTENQKEQNHAALETAWKEPEQKFTEHTNEEPANGPGPDLKQNNKISNSKQFCG